MDLDIFYPPVSIFKLDNLVIGGETFVENITSVKNNLIVIDKPDCL